MRNCMPQTYQWVMIPFTPKAPAVKKLTFDEITNFVCAYYMVHPSIVLRGASLGTHVRARHTAMYLMRVFVKKTTVREIGKYFNRDHSSVSHACDKVQDMIRLDKKYRAEYDHIHTALRQRERAVA